MCDVVFGNVQDFSAKRDPVLRLFRVHLCYFFLRLFSLHTDDDCLVCVDFYVVSFKKTLGLVQDLGDAFFRVAYPDCVIYEGQVVD